MIQARHRIEVIFKTKIKEDGQKIFINYQSKGSLLVRFTNNHTKIKESLLWQNQENPKNSEML